MTEATSSCSGRLACLAGGTSGCATGGVPGCGSKRLGCRNVCPLLHRALPTSLPCSYFGPLGFESSALIAYLEAVPGVQPIRAGSNPATWCVGAEAWN